MIDLTEMEQRVLSELEEFWEENVFAMLNTIIEPAGDAREVALLQQALRGLVERDYVVMGLQGFSLQESKKNLKGGPRWTSSPTSEIGSGSTWSMPTGH